MTSTTTAERAPVHGFFAVSAALFVTSAAITIARCTAMPAAGGMSMPGGWTMSMAWMRMPGQTWPAAAGSFLGMWIVMMAAMMQPSLVPALWRYRQTLETATGAPAGWLTAIAAVGYFAVWSLTGLAVYALGVLLTTIEMRQPAVARAVPLVAGLVVMIAGSLQFTVWKARHLACCREPPLPGGSSTARGSVAWRRGVRLGLRCVRCCANLMVVLLAIGVMDLGAMAVVAAAITSERLAPAGVRVARAVGVGVVAAGMVLLARAAGLDFI